MNTYIITFSRNDYGKILIKAETEQEARDKFDTGDYTENDMNIKGGDTVLEDIEY